MILVMCCIPSAFVQDFICHRVDHAAHFVLGDIHGDVNCAVLVPFDGHARFRFRHLEGVAIRFAHTLSTFCNTAAKVGIFFDTATHLATFL